MTQRLKQLVTLAFTCAAALAALFYMGLPLRSPVSAAGGLVGAIDDVAVDASRVEVFAKEPAPRVVPFQILYGAASPGAPSAYAPDAAATLAVMARERGLLPRLALGALPRLLAPWTKDASPVAGAEMPVVLYLPGATGYAQMGSFQTVALARRGYVVVVLAPPGLVAAVRLPDGHVVRGMSLADLHVLVDPEILTNTPLPREIADRILPEATLVDWLARDVPAVLARLDAINRDPASPLRGRIDTSRVALIGMSLGAVIGSKACKAPAISACLLIDAPVPRDVVRAGIRPPVLWLSRPAEDQRAERAASGGWSEAEIAAQADSISQAVAMSSDGRVEMLHGLFHVDFTDLPLIQPALGWFGQSGPKGGPQAAERINVLTLKFLDPLLHP